ncbi:MAG: hypothetical protein U0794_07420 [Isosphaeraceae bacterium]
MEAGPGASCTRLIRTILADQPHLARAASTSIDDLLDLLARLIAEPRPRVAGRPVRPTHPGGRHRRTNPTSTRGSVTIRVGGAPLRSPELPEIEPHQRFPEPPAVPYSPVLPVSQPIQDTHGDPIALTPGPLAPILAPPAEAWTPHMPTDPIAAEVAATSTADAAAHATFLRVASDLGRRWPTTWPSRWH